MRTATAIAAAPAPVLTEENDLALARRIADGEAAAFELMMRRHNRRLFRLARATLRNDADAEDALQDAYLAAYRSIARFRGDASLFTWLSRLVLNECFGRLRKRGRREALCPIAGDIEDEADAMIINDFDPPYHAAARSQLRALLEARLDALPVAFRTVFVLRSVEELSVEETATCLGIPEATVRSRHFRANAMLRESLSHDIDATEKSLFEFDGDDCDRIVASTLARLRDEEPD